MIAQPLTGVNTNPIVMNQWTEHPDRARDVTDAVATLHPNRLGLAKYHRFKNQQNQQRQTERERESEGCNSMKKKLAAVHKLGVKVEAKLKAAAATAAANMGNEPLNFV